jgi:hypothetical protein
MQSMKLKCKISSVTFGQNSAQERDHVKYPLAVLCIQSPQAKRISSFIVTVNQSGKTRKEKSFRNV